MKNAALIKPINLIPIEKATALCALVQGVFERTGSTCESIDRKEGRGITVTKTEIYSHYLVTVFLRKFGIYDYFNRLLWP